MVAGGVFPVAYAELRDREQQQEDAEQLEHE
jgi:hypothetical protein